MVDDLARLRRRLEKISNSYNRFKVSPKGKGTMDTNAFLNDTSYLKLLVQNNCLLLKYSSIRFYAWLKLSLVKNFRQEKVL